MAIYGYARVSTDGQSLAAQLAELKAAAMSSAGGRPTPDELR
jgi:DNA invertase Pin-like site-specific DNA recombinase